MSKLQALVASLFVSETSFYNNTVQVYIIVLSPRIYNLRLYLVFKLFKLPLPTHNTGEVLEDAHNSRVLLSS